MFDHDRSRHWAGYGKTAGEAYANWARLGAQLARMNKIHGKSGQ